MRMSKKELLQYYPQFNSEKPNNQWSEEDEDSLESVMMWLDECEPQYVEKDKAWLESVKERLKSLRPTWKPSEEQMKALKISKEWEGLTYEEMKNLDLLYEQLKAL